ncbi:MAG: 1-deoxy-D-xylulose-5-phosphate synthase [Oscillospiraceae bacterium]|jgi:1-deoxy-D-xylulose-5-phosphate synthase|nr:1-deoxy-D-xylulose-5-phosphate synthase [Oscillospiraceae bacterium]
MDESKSEALNYLPNIHCPADVKQLPQEALPELAKEIRQTLIDTVSKTGGHLASNLGVVELTIALHKTFNSPYDKIVWDVGHQAYVHKLLTGRYHEFSTLRTENGISGFPRPCESEHDVFAGGHSSTALSAALGIAQANQIKGNKNYTIAVIGDGAFTGGMVYEAMNNVANSSSRLIVILNNNEMSISRNVGKLAEYLAVIKSRPQYFRLKATTDKVLKKIPIIGRPLASRIVRIKTFFKNQIYSSTIFEHFGFRYMGPIDGHNIPVLCDALQSAKESNYPIFLHLRTIKGKGYEHAEKDPCGFHGISRFDINSGEPITSGPNFSKEFGDYLVEAAAKDRRICAITAAMTSGTGLSAFAEHFPERFFDVGIAEQHAVTFSCGLAKAGMLPVFAVYSAFLQRAYDQIVHDGTLQEQKIILAVDRAGFVGDDGEMHHGLLDVPFLNTIPGVTVYSPSTYAEMRNAFYKSLYHQKGVVAVRYYRGKELPLPGDFSPSFRAFDLYGSEDAHVFLVTYGRLFSYACEAQKRLAEEGISCAVLKLNRIKPISQKAIDAVQTAEQIFFFEEGEQLGGAGEHFLSLLNSHGWQGGYTLTAVPDSYAAHASVERLLERFSLDAEGMHRVVREKMQIKQKKTFKGILYD